MKESERESKRDREEERERKDERYKDAFVKIVHVYSHAPNVCSVCLCVSWMSVEYRKVRHKL